MGRKTAIAGNRENSYHLLEFGTMRSALKSNPGRDLWGLTVPPSNGGDQSESGGGGVTGCAKASFEECPFGTFRPSVPTGRVLGITRRLPDRVWSRALSSVCRRLLADETDGPVDTEVYEFRMRLYPGDNLCEKRVLYAPHWFDRAEREFLKTTLGGGSSFVDLGANVGVYSLVAAQACGDNARVVAVEPDPWVRRRLEFNVLASQFRCISIEDAAVSDHGGKIDLYLDPENRGRNSIVFESGESIRVRAVSLRELLDAHGIDRPDCLKLDIEGAEEKVLRQFFREVSAERHPGAIILEQHRKQPLSSAGALLIDRGYRLLERTRMNLILRKS